MPFGQVVIGPPGSGKTTYCNGAAQFLAAAGRRVAMINLDPANDVLPYKPDVDVCDLVCLEGVMAQLGLGPNGGASRGGQRSGRRAPQPLLCVLRVYCIEQLEQSRELCPPHKP